jgi:hypothetical protein
MPPPDGKCSDRITGRTAESQKFAIECPAERVWGESEIVCNPQAAAQARSA